jgi:hypothetical protein
LATVPQDDDSLALAYYITVSPPLASADVLHAFFGVLCRAGITEAFYFTRKRDDTSRKELFELLVTSILRSEPGSWRGEIANEMIRLPLDDREEQWLDDCLLRGRAKHLQGAKDSVMMRRVATGRLDNLGNDLESLVGKQMEGITWDVLKRNMRQGAPAAEA